MSTIAITTENLVSGIDLRAASAENAAGPAGADAVYTAAIAELLDPQAPAETLLARLAAGMVLLRSVSRRAHFVDVYWILHELLISAWSEAVAGIDQEELETRGLLPELGGIWLPSDNFGRNPVYPAWFSEEDLENVDLISELTLSDDEVAERAPVPLEVAAAVAVDLYGTRILPTAA